MIDRNAFEDLIDKVVILDNWADPDNLERKIELLCFALEELKYARGGETEKVSFEEYVQSEVRVRNHKLIISAPQKVRNVGAGTSPIQLQAPLLLFLLLNHKERYQVLDIIRLFIEQMRGHLTFLDFKKTKTGVTRCFTNTRFAAHVLRDYGLLKFTRQEAFKTWELSLSGFLVAADILERRSRSQSPWEVSAINKDAKLDLATEIYIASDGLQNFDDFVRKLSSICAPDVEIFKTFGPVLTQAFDLLQSYWLIIKDPSKSQQERRKASLDRIKALDALGGTFLNELARCIQINDALRRALLSYSC